MCPHYQFCSAGNNWDRKSWLYAHTLHTIQQHLHYLVYVCTPMYVYVVHLLHIHIFPTANTTGQNGQALCGDLSSLVQRKYGGQEAGSWAGL